MRAYRNTRIHTHTLRVKWLAMAGVAWKRPDIVISARNPLFQCTINVQWKRNLPFLTESSSFLSVWIAVSPSALQPYSHNVMWSWSCSCTKVALWCKNLIARFVFAPLRTMAAAAASSFDHTMLHRFTSKIVYIYNCNCCGSCTMRIEIQVWGQHRIELPLPLIPEH